MIKRILIIVLSVFLLAGILLTAADMDYLLTGVRTVYLRGQKGVGIYDFTVQPTCEVPARPGDKWPLHPQYNKIPLSDSIVKMHEQLKTTAFIIITDGKIISESYFDEGGPEKLSGVWSVSKTYTALLMLKAVEDGLIKSIDDPVALYLPEWNVNQEKKLTIRHLCSMSTGLFWDEMDQTPLSLIAKLNFYGDLEKFTLNDLYAVGEPGVKQHYDSGGMQLLGTVLNRVLGDKSISQYMAEKLWQPLRAQNNALYVLDSKKHQNEKTYGGLAATARDISRLGNIIVNDGYWNGTRILSAEQMNLLKTIPYNNETYAFGIWTGLYKGQRFYYQSGHSGQFCVSFPAHKLVITRFGHRNLPKPHMEAVSPDVPVYIEEALRILQQAKKLQ